MCVVTVPSLQEGEYLHLAIVQLFPGKKARGPLHPGWGMTKGRGLPLWCCNGGTRSHEGLITSDLMNFACCGTCHHII